ncbi:uncharacterized protein [Macrobrachium rosenbergii]|uniref:uncharacterized protein isoform X2 n=1 Tax=Macrobrachium rosenbergii TaxID=79674 RepID=UPI0034D5FD5D
MKFPHPLRTSGGGKRYQVICILASFVLARSHPKQEYPLVPWEDLWDELDEMTLGKDFCEVERGYCWYNSTRMVEDSPFRPLDRNDLNVLCQCDSDCVRYGDCCRDRAEADWGDGREEGSSRYSCRKMQTISTVGVLMVESCKAGYEDKTVENLCRQEVSASAYSYVLDLPVTSKDSNVTYVNFHCAVCNDDAANLHRWNVTINCATGQIKRDFTMAEFMAEAQYFPGQRRWERFTYRSPADKRHKVYQNRYYCSLEVEEFENKTEFALNYGGRLCMFPKSTCPKDRIGKSFYCKEQVRHCHPSWPDRLDREKCQRYSHFVTFRDDEGRETYYKNPHCARCNFVNVSSSHLKCFNPPGNATSSNRRANSRGMIPVFSVLMDFRSKDCNKENELWDPIHMKCQKILCGYLFKLENGQCVRDEKVFEKLRNSSVLDDSCPKILLRGYLARENGSVFMNASKKIYAVGSYEIVNTSHILICNEGRHYLLKFSDAHKCLTLIVMVISIVSLALHIAIYMLVPRFRNLPGRNLFSLACCLFMAHILFLTGTGATWYHGLCVSLSAILHYFWMASFCWMNVMSVDVCRTFRSQMYRGDLNSRKTYICYSVYAWGVPALVVMLALVFDNVDVVADYRPEYGTDYCWINNRYGLILFFVLPVGAIVVENMVLYFVTICCICKQAKAARYAGTRSQSVKESQTGSEGKGTKGHHKHLKTQSQGHRGRKDRIRLVLYVKLGVIQGLTWLLGVLGAFADIPILWYFFTAFNGLQGAFIFLGFDLKRKVTESVWEAITGRPWKKDHHLSQTNNHTVSTFTHSRSSKSSSDSEGDNQLDTSVSHFGAEDGNSLPFDDTLWSGKNRHGKLKSCQKSSSRLAGCQTTGAEHGSKNLAKTLSPEDSGTCSRSRVRNGDLRGSVVKGKFADEKSEDFAALSRIRAGLGINETAVSNKRRKSDLQKVVDLLQQLQQAKNPSSIHGVVQLLLNKRGSLEGNQCKQPNPSDAVTRLHDKNNTSTNSKKAARELDENAAAVFPTGSVKSSEERFAPQTLPCVQKKSRPKSSSNFTSDTSQHYQTKLPSTKHCSSVEKIATRHKEPSDTSRSGSRPQSFAQVSQVALAVAKMQRKQGFPHEADKYGRRSLTSSKTSREAENHFESLV